MTKPWLVKVGALFVKKEDASFFVFYLFSYIYIQQEVGLNIQSDLLLFLYLKTCL